MNRIQAKKLLNSKWTKLKSTNKERHFLVSELKYDENNTISQCFLEAVISKRTEPIDWNELKDSSIWLQGWK
jgi:tryptophan-rich hypothetical protein